MLQLSCTVPASKVETTGNSQGSANSTTSQTPIDETVVPPSSIAGSLLTCLNEIDATEEIPQFLLGCRFEDEKERRKSLGEIAEKVDFAYQAPGQNDVKVQMKPIVGDKKYDVLFLVIGPEPVAVSVAAAELRVRALLRKTVNDGKDTQIAASIKIYQESNPRPAPGQQPSLPLPEEYDDMRKEMLTDFEGGKTTPPL